MYAYIFISCDIISLALQGTFQNRNQDLVSLINRDHQVPEADLLRLLLRTTHLWALATTSSLQVLLSRSEVWRYLASVLQNTHGVYTEILLLYLEHERSSHTTSP